MKYLLSFAVLTFFAAQALARFPGRRSTFTVRQFESEPAETTEPPPLTQTEHGSSHIHITLRSIKDIPGIESEQERVQTEPGSYSYRTMFTYPDIDAVPTFDVNYLYQHVVPSTVRPMAYIERKLLNNSTTCDANSRTAVYALSAN